PLPPTMMIGLSHSAGLPFTRRWLRVAGPPHTTQIAWNLSTTSAIHISVGIGPNGRPRKSTSVPARITRTPLSARRFARSTMPSSRNCASSTATTSVPSRRRRAISSAESTGSASTVTPSCEDTEKSPAYRASRWDLKTCTCLRAMTARRTRRINSSDLPLNITPEMTSIHPERVGCWNTWDLTRHVGTSARAGRTLAAVASPGKRASCRRVPLKKLGILRISEGYPIVLQYSCGFPRTPFKEIAVNKAELTSALAMRTKMSKADATRTIEALFDDKGIIAGELKKGSKVQITGFGNFEARKRAARMGRNPKTGGVIQIKASIAPAFRAGKQLKQVVNKKK